MTSLAERCAEKFADDPAALTELARQFGITEAAMFEMAKRYRRGDFRVHLNWGGARNWDDVRRIVLRLYPRAQWGGNFADISTDDPAGIATALSGAGLIVYRGRDADPLDLRISLPSEAVA